MSVTFSIMKRHEDGTLRFAYRCDCSQRWCDACDEADAKGEKYPPQFTCDQCTDTDINMANMNAMEWLTWVGLTADYGGEIEASKLAVLCRRRLWDEARNHDPAIPGEVFQSMNGPRVIISSRRPGYLRERTEQMLKLCEKAGDRVISWG